MYTFVLPRMPGPTAGVTDEISQLLSVVSTGPEATTHSLAMAEPSSCEQIPDISSVAPLQEPPMSRRFPRGRWLILEITMLSSLEDFETQTIRLSS